MAFLKPDTISTTTNGLIIKQKIIPDSMKAAKDVASWCKKGSKMKPGAKLNNGTGKPKGITIHNTGDIKVAAGTNAAEQYTRATFNGNMAGVVVHFYVWDNEIWQNLREDERGWHAADGSTRRKSQRKDGSTIGGNLDTIAIECIGNRKGSEDTTAKLAAHLCKKYKLDPATDIYTHKYFYPAKNCPLYILPHWSSFLSSVREYYNRLSGKTDTVTASNDTDTVYTVKHGDTLWAIAHKYLGKGLRYNEIVKLNGLKTNVIYTGQKLKMPKK
jgi:N-acetylmuramoyl-L-alanine amidase CwlA